MHILLFGDGAWAANSLKRLSQEGRSLAGVVVRAKSSDETLENLARELGLAVYRPASVNDPAFLSNIAELKPDLNLSISYNQIFRRPMIELAPLGFVNFHAGKLPYYRGRNVINWALINGESEIGLTAHYIDEGIDTGDIILQRTLPVSWTDTYGDVLRNVVDAFPSLVSEAVSLIADGSAVRQPQADGLHGTYFASRADGDEWLDWTDTSYNLHNKIRAISRPGPGARTTLGGDPVIIWRAFYDTCWPKYIATPGQVVGLNPQEGVLVKTGDSTLLVEEVQRGGDEPMTPRWPIGTRVGVDFRA